jgi:hypothetical protein
VSLCSKPGCTRTGTAVLGYDYSERLAVLDDPGEPSPHVYVLCAPCAAKLTPPKGWTLRDRRREVLEVEAVPGRRVFFEAANG